MAATANTPGQPLHGASRFREWLRHFGDLLLHAGSLTGERLEAAVWWYVTNVRRVLIGVAVVAATILLVLLVAIAFQIEAALLYSVLMGLLGTAVVCALLLLMPLVAVVTLVAKTPLWNVVERPIRLVLTGVFFTTLAVLFFLVYPVAQHPRQIPVFIVLVIALPLGGYLGWVKVSPKTIARFITLKLQAVLFLLVFAWMFPKTLAWSRQLTARVDRLVSQLWTHPVRLGLNSDSTAVTPFVLGAVAYDVTDQEGGPRVWFSRNELSGEYLFYDRSGYDEAGRALRPLAGTEVSESAWIWIREWRRAQTRRVVPPSPPFTLPEPVAVPRVSGIERPEITAAPPPAGPIPAPEDSSNRLEALRARFDDAVRNAQVGDGIPNADLQALLSGRRIRLHFSEATVESAAAISRRLTAFGATVVVEPNASPPVGSIARLEYGYADLRVAEAIEIALAPIQQIQLNSRGGAQALVLTFY